MNNICFLSWFFSIASQPGVDQPSIFLRDDTRRSYILGGLKPDKKYRVQVRAQTSVGLSTTPAIIELTTNLSVGKRCKTIKKRSMISCLLFYSSIETSIYSVSSRNNILQCFFRSNNNGCSS